jgi:ABC-type uncharacterized transport system substrate-binding protein
MSGLLRSVVLILTGLLLFCLSVSAADKEEFSTGPKAKNGGKWRIGYYEGGEYSEYQGTFTAVVYALMELGWIENAKLPEQTGEETRALWNWLSDNTKSDTLEFVKDAHYSANWDKKLREKMAAEIIDRLKVKKDIDLMIAMGTWAGKDLANNEHSTPVMVLSTSDPLTAGIIKSVEDSGYDHVHARIDPTRYERQVRLFNDITGFKKLGVAYEESLVGRSYAAIDNIEKVAKERGFEIVRCYTQGDEAPLKAAEQSVKDCFGTLGQTADAIYVTEQAGVNTSSIPDLVKTAIFHRTPTFAQLGSEFVKYGILVSISQAGYKYVGRFHAETFAKVFNGAKPRQLDQLFEEPPKIAINLETAVSIGFDPPVEILGAADEIYREIAKPK